MSIETTTQGIPLSPEERPEEPTHRIILKKPIPKDITSLFNRVEPKSASIPEEEPQQKFEENGEVERIPEEESEAIFEKAEIHGDEFNGRQLTKETLAAGGLQPKYRASVGDATIWFSSHPFEIAGKRAAVIAYVDKGNKIVARSYYRSNSQGIWRYLPSCVLTEDGQIAWYNKGVGEQSITLPIAIQSALSKIVADNETMQIGENSDFIFAGTCRNSLLRSTYVGEISLPKKLNPDFISDSGLVPPENIRLSQGQSPDFSNLIDSWSQSTDLYGVVDTYVFESQDKKLRYMFCSDALGRAWVAGLEDTGPILSTGLKKSWINGGNLLTPAYEYSNQAGVYGNPNLKTEDYVDMYENYLSKIDVIAKFQDWKRGLDNQGDSIQS